MYQWQIEKVKCSFNFFLGINQWNVCPIHCLYVSDSSCRKSWERKKRIARFMKTWWAVHESNLYNCHTQLRHEKSCSASATQNYSSEYFRKSMWFATFQIVYLYFWKAIKYSNISAVNNMYRVWYEFAAYFQ